MGKPVKIKTSNYIFMLNKLRAILNNRLIDSAEKISLTNDSLCLEFAQKLKNQRLSIGITKSDLSRKTKISVAVIEAIENGWTQNLPETTYLAPMLEVLEKELKLDKQSLKKIIKSKEPKEDIHLSNNHKSISIKLFSRYQGITIYVLFILLSIFLLNRYQLKLSENNLQTITPIPYNPTEPNEEINKSVDSK